MTKLLIINHAHEPYLNADNPAEAQLLDDIMGFVSEAREHVDKVIWLHADKPMRSSAYQEGDLELPNREGQGNDPEIRDTLGEIFPDDIILVGAFFENCINNTAKYMKDYIPGVNVTIPMDMTTPPEEQEEMKAYFHKVRQELHDKGIDVSSNSQDVLQELQKPNIPVDGWDGPAGAGETPSL